MKKFLLTLATVALGFSAYAGEVTFDFTENNYGLTPYNEDLGNNSPYVETPATITQGDVSILLEGEIDKESTGWRMWSDGLRAYYKRFPTFTVSTTNGENVKYITWKIKTGAKFSTTADGAAITEWSGDAASVTLYDVGTANGAVESITVGYGDYTASEPTPEPDAPEFTVEEAIKYLAEGNSGVAIVSGVVTSVGTFNSNYGSLTYNIGDFVEDTETLQIYAGLGLNGKEFTSKNEVVVGAEVQVKGELKIYVNADGVEIYEMDMNSVLLSYKVPDGVDVPEIPDAPQGILSVREAVENYIEKGYEGEATVKGIITEITEVSEQYGNATYIIKDSETDAVSLTVFRGYYLDGEKFTSEDQLELGATVTVTGKLQDYNGTFEITNSSIIDYTPAGIESLFMDSNEPIEYYNLQGVRVNNPEQGVYILRQGKKSVKTIIR